MQETQEMQVWSLDWEDPLEKRMTSQFSILAWRIPRTEEPGGLHSMWFQRFRHDCSDVAGRRAPDWLLPVSSSGPAKRGFFFFFLSVVPTQVLGLSLAWLGSSPIFETADMPWRWLWLGRSGIIPPAQVDSPWEIRVLLEKGKYMLADKKHVN